MNLRNYRINCCTYYLNSGNVKTILFGLIVFVLSLGITLIVDFIGGELLGPFFEILKSPLRFLQWIILIIGSIFLAVGLMMIFNPLFYLFFMTLRFSIIFIFINLPLLSANYLIHFFNKIANGKAFGGIGITLASLGVLLEIDQVVTILN